MPALLFLIICITCGFIIAGKLFAGHHAFVRCWDGVTVGLSGGLLPGEPEFDGPAVKMAHITSQIPVPVYYYLRAHDLRREEINQQEAAATLRISDRQVRRVVRRVREEGEKGIAHRMRGWDCMGFPPLSAQRSGGQ